MQVHRKLKTLKTQISLLKVKLLNSLRGFYNIHEIKDVNVNVLLLGVVCINHFETAMFVTHALPTHTSYIWFCLEFHRRICQVVSTITNVT